MNVTSTERDLSVAELAAFANQPPVPMAPPPAVTEQETTTVPDVAPAPAPAKIEFDRLTAEIALWTAAKDEAVERFERIREAEISPITSRLFHLDVELAAAKTAMEVEAFKQIAPTTVAQERIFEIAKAELVARVIEFDSMP
jgi:hypothetical protein